MNTDRTDHSGCTKEENPMIESWAPIPGFTHYQASTEGRVRSVDRQLPGGYGGLRTVKGRIIAVNHTHGSPKVSITADGAGQRNRGIAGLVLAAFVGPAPSPAHKAKPINGDPNDVRLANLEWVAPKPPKARTPRPAGRPATRPAAAAARPPARPAPPTEAIIDLTGLPRMNPNDGAYTHWGKKHRAAQEIRTVVTLRARQARIPTGLRHVTIEYHFRPAEDRYRLDPRNLASLLLWKHAQDALHAHRGGNTSGARGPKHPVVHDDSPGFMTEVGPTQHPAVKGEPAAAWLVIRWGNDEQKAS